METRTVKKIKKPDLARHESHCAVCSHPRRQEIEVAFVEWTPQSRIAKDFRLTGRLTILRHAKALGLVTKRNANIRAVLANHIERASSVRPTAQSLISACVAFSKLDAEGRSVDRIESVTGLSSLFSRMTRGEALNYAETGQLPSWWLPDTSNAKETI
jgi:hypothetical protein